MKIQSQETHCVLRLNSKPTKFTRCSPRLNMTTSLSFASVVIWTGVVAAFFLAGLVALNPAHVVEASLGTVPLDAIGLGRLGKLTLGIRVRPVNAALLLLITVVAGIVAAFSARNLPGQHRTTRFSLLQIVVVSSLSLCVTAASLPLLALGWTIAGLAVAALVEHSDTKPAREAASLVRARMLLGDVAIWIACICLGVAVGSLDIVDLFEFSVSAAARDSTLMTVSAFLILLGGGIRSTLVPFHDWLPETAEAPTPVSALLHAGWFDLDLDLSQQKLAYHLFIHSIPSFLPSFLPRHRKRHRRPRPPPPPRLSRRTHRQLRPPRLWRADRPRRNRTNSGTRRRQRPVGSFHDESDGVG